MSGFGIASEKVPTMKSLDSDKKPSGIPKTKDAVVEEKIDFSKVKVEPLFEEYVDFETFSKSDFRAVKVKACEAVKKSKKLLQFTLDDGTGTDRTILSGIHAYYEPEELVGKTLIAITNDILDDAVLYLRVYFVGFPFLFMYNILSTMFTSIGESKIPLGLLIFSSILNIVMDLWMVADLGLGVFGAALATLIAQGISAVFSLLIFFARMQRYKSPFNRFERQELYSMLRIAVPSVCSSLPCPSV